MTTFNRDWIDKATYQELLRKNRFAPIGDELFLGDLGGYFMKAMNEKKNKLSPDEQVQASKNVGWD